MRLSHKPQTENLVSEISVLKDSELGKSEAHWGRKSFSFLVSTTSEAKPTAPGAGARKAHPPEGTGRGASKERVGVADPAATCRAGPILTWSPLYTHCQESSRGARDYVGTWGTFVRNPSNILKIQEALG